MEGPLIVTIRCLVYNHEPYLRKCLNGFVKQNTNFRFEAIVHDDASTDGSADIIREYAEKYPDIIKPVIETENQYSKRDGSLRRVMDAHMHGKYIAMCEGDDYWTDPYKLQKQVDFLEANPEYGLVYTAAEKFFQDKNTENGVLKGEENITFDTLLKYNPIPTLTVMLRTEAYKGFNELISKKQFKMGDYPLWLYISMKYKIHYIDDITAVYRVLENSASHSDNFAKKCAFVSSAYDVRLFFAEYCNRDVVSIANRCQQDLFTLAYINKEYKYAIEQFRKINYKFYRLKDLLRYIICLMKNIANK